MSLVFFFPLSPLYFHADLSCFSLLTHLFTLLSDKCSQVLYISSCLSLCNISLCTYKTWPIFFIYLHTHKYILVSCILMLSIQNLSKHCKEFLFLGLLIWASFLFSLFVPWVSFEFRWIFCFRALFGSASALHLVYLILSPSGSSYSLFIIIIFSYSFASPAICPHQKS